MIGAGIILIAGGCLIPLVSNHRWDNFIYGAALGIGVVIVCLFVAAAIQHAKARV
jgi:hypothetical protein